MQIRGIRGRYRVRRTGTDNIKHVQSPNSKCYSNFIYTRFTKYISPGAGEHNWGLLPVRDTLIFSYRVQRRYVNIYMVTLILLFIRVVQQHRYHSMIQCWTMAYIGIERGVRRIKSWTIQGSNNDSDWTTIHTVTNKPPSNYRGSSYE